MTHQEMAKVVLDALNKGDHRGTWFLLQLSLRVGLSPDTCLARVRQMAEVTYDYDAPGA